MDLFNTTSRELDPIDDPAKLHEAILAGTHAFQNGTRVTVIPPDSSSGVERETIPAENIAAAIRAGYSVETPTQAKIREYLEKNQGLRGDVKVGLAQFGDEALLGIPEMIYNKTGDPLEVAKKEALKREHELANTVGGVGGFAASMLIPGPSLIFRGASKAGAKATELVAEKLMVQAGEELGKRTAKRIAGEILSGVAAKGAGGAVEGAIISAPHAITEAALGDPGDAAETLVAGVGIGALLGGGGSLAKDFFKLGKEGLVKGAGAISGQKENAQSVARKLAKVMTGVEEDQILHYVENAERANAVGSREQVMDAINEAVGREATSVATSRAARDNASARLEEAYKAAKFEKSRATAPQSLADDLQGALEEQKSYLGSLSEQADDALERSGVTFQKQDVLDLIDKVGGAIGTEGKDGARVVISKEAQTAVGRLKAQRDAIAEGFDNEIAAPQLRGILRDVRRDINYNQISGEFNDTFNKAAKTYTSAISDALKGRGAAAEKAGLGAVPELQEYAAYMERMSKLSDSLERASQKFGTRERAVGTLNSILTPKGKLNEEILAEFGQLTGRDYVSALKGYKDSAAVMERIAKGEDLRGELVPALSKELADAEAAHLAATERYSGISRLTPEKTQAVIRNQGFKNASIQDRRALERLGELEDAGTKYLDMVKDRNALDAFQKSHRSGSRMVNLMGAMLGSTFGPVGAGIGAGLGATLDDFGGAILKKMIDGTPNMSGLLFVEQAMKRTAEKLDGIPAALERMASGKRLPSPKGAAVEAVMRLIEPKVELKPDDMKPANRVKQIERLNEKASVLASNGIGLQENLAAFSGLVGQRGAPNIAAAFSQKMATGLSYLQTQIPKPPRPRTPFAPKVQWKPNDYDLHSFEQKAQVVHDPFSAINLLEAGALTKNHTDALKAVYPGIFQMMQRKVWESAHTAKPLSYKDRTALSYLFGAPLDPSQTPEAVLYYQRSFNNQATAAEAQDARGNDQRPFKPEVEIASGAKSDTTRLATRKLDS